MSNTTVTITSETFEYMADHIEELEAELSEVKKDAERTDAIWCDNYEALKAKLAKVVEERDQAWKRAGHAEKMWGETEVKLAKAVEALRGWIEFAKEEGIPVSLSDLEAADLTGGKDE